MTADNRLGLTDIRRIPDGMRQLDSAVAKIRASSTSSEQPDSHGHVIDIEQILIRRMPSSELNALKRDVRYLGQPRR